MDVHPGDIISIVSPEIIYRLISGQVLPQKIAELIRN
jgi:hypothetical protein